MFMRTASTVGKMARGSVATGRCKQFGMQSGSRIHFHTLPRKGRMIGMIRNGGQQVSGLDCYGWSMGMLRKVKRRLRYIALPKAVSGNWKVVCVIPNQWITIWGSSGCLVA